MRTRRRAKKAHDGSACLPKSGAAGRAGANGGDENSKLFLRRGRDIEKLLSQPPTALLKLHMS
jgi:hypothetical protein